jgi:hypothetical protein
VEIVTPGNNFSTDGPYGAEGFIYQEYAPLPEFRRPLSRTRHLIIDGEAAGMGIRESDTLITDNQSRFVPHVIDWRGEGLRGDAGRLMRAWEGTPTKSVLDGFTTKSSDGLRR